MHKIHRSRVSKPSRGACIGLKAGRYQLLSARSAPPRRRLRGVVLVSRNRARGGSERSDPPHRDRAVEACERRAHRLEPVRRRHPRHALRRRARGRGPGRSRARALRALEGSREPRAVRGAARDGRDRRRRAGELLRRRQPPRDASRPRAARRRFLHRLARPWALARDGLGARGASLGQPAAHVRAHERRRVQRGLGLGGGHVRRAPRAREPRR